jgi:O-antigen/teichoic acid export membrane protein
MGIVARQSIITSIISYTGIVVGYLNLVYLYPKYLELQEIGLLRTIQDAAMLMVPVASFGLPQIISRFYPRYSTETVRYSGFLGLLFITATVGILVVCMIFSLTHGMVMNSFAEKAPMVIKHSALILLLVALLCYYGILEQLARSQVQIALPAFLREVLMRLLQAGIVLLYAGSVINLDQFLLLSVLLYGALILFLIFRLEILKQLPSMNFRNFHSGEFREIFLFGLTGFIGIGSSMVIAKIDSLMVSGMIGLEAAAIYTTTFYMATVIEVPKRALTQSATAILSVAFEKNDMQSAGKIYRQTALNQMIIGGLLLIGLWANTPSIFSLMPRGDLYAAGFYVILLVGATRLIDMSFGPSSEVIGLSKHYWFNLVVISLLAALSILLNYLLIPVYGISGAAIGTLISIFSFNLIKFIFISTRLGITPFSSKTITTLIVIALTAGLNLIIPAFESIWVDVFIRSFLLSIFYAGLIFMLKCSPELSEQLSIALKKTGLKKKSE